MTADPPAEPHPGETDAGAGFPKVLIFSMQEPDSPSGSPAILADILERWPRGKASILCEMRVRPERRRNIEIGHPMKRLRLLAGLWRAKRGAKIRRILWTVSWPLLLLLGLKELRATRAEAILTIYTDGLWISAAYWLSRISGVPLLFYVHDAWRERVAHARPWLGGFAERLERAALGHSTLVVLSKGLEDLYRDRYGLESTLVRHMATGPRFESQPPTDVQTLGFAGAIYGNNLTQLQGLVGLIAELDGWRLRLFTDAPADRLRSLGLVGQKVEAVFESDPEVLRRNLSQCTALYLPLAFEDASDLPVSLLRHAVPTKTVDYLMAGPPILVHCPENFEVASLVAGLQAGVVCGTAGVTGLGDLLRNWRVSGPSKEGARGRARALALFGADENFEKLRACAWVAARNRKC